MGGRKGSLVTSDTLDLGAELVLPCPAELSGRRISSTGWAPNSSSVVRSRSVTAGLPRDQVFAPRAANTAGVQPSATCAPAVIQDTVSVHLARLVRDAGVQFGLSREEIMSIPEFNSDAFEDDLGRIPTAAQHRLWELVHATGGPHTGLRVAATAELGRLHVWDYLITGGNTLAEGFSDAAAYLTAIADPALMLHVAEDGPLLTVGYFGNTDREAVDTQTSEFAMAVLMRRAREARGAAVTPVRVGFAHRAPQHHGAFVDHFGTSNIHFDQDADTLTFHEAEGAVVRSPRDPEFGRIMRLYAQSIIDSARPARSEIDALRAVVLDVLAAGVSTGQVFDEVAHRLSVSSRTLQRRLAAHGTTWRAEFEAVQHEQAVRLLQDTQLPLQSIAGRLGYSDHRTLGRAFRRWTGQTPDEYRKSSRATT